MADFTLTEKEIEIVLNAISGTLTHVSEELGQKIEKILHEHEAIQHQTKRS